MKIAFFVDAFPVLSETFILNQIIGLINNGHEVDIYSRGRGSQDVVHPEVLKYDLIKRVFYFSDIPKSVTGRVGFLLQTLVRSNVLLKPSLWVRIIGVFASKKTRNSFPKLVQLTMMLRQEESEAYDIIHSQYGTLGRSVILLKENGVLPGKHVTSFRGHDITQQAYRKSGYYDDLFAKGDLFLPVSNSLKKMLTVRGCASEKIHILHSGINSEKFVCRARNLEKGAPVNILTVARLVEMKGVEYGIKAVASLIDSGKSIQYKIAGDGILCDQLEKLIVELGMESSIKLLGWQNHDSITKLMDDTHILLTPSVTAANGEQEGIPNVVKEAMAMCIPVVSTLHSGIPELLENGVSGYLVPERDELLLAESLAKLINSPDSWPEMGLAGRKKVEADFDIQKLNDKLIELYRSILAK